MVTDLAMDQDLRYYRKLPDNHHPGLVSDLDQDLVTVTDSVMVTVTDSDSGSDLDSD